MKFVCSIILLLTLLSCDKKLDSSFVDDEYIELEYYRISRFTSIHDYIDLSLKSSGVKVNIYEANAYEIDSLYIRNDTIFIDNIYESPIIYHLLHTEFGYQIVLN